MPPQHPVGFIARVPLDVQPSELHLETLPLARELDPASCRCVNHHLIFFATFVHTQTAPKRSTLGRSPRLCEIAAPKDVRRLGPEPLASSKHSVIPSGAEGAILCPPLSIRR
jgi:hypothetical protein